MNLFLLQSHSKTTSIQCSKTKVKLVHRFQRDAVFSFCCLANFQSQKTYASLLWMTRTGSLTLCTELVHTDTIRSFFLFPLIFYSNFVSPFFTFTTNIYTGVSSTSPPRSVAKNYRR
ncbi:unnamed protein product [Amoebophrya sp. A25]|nr:unnamed protein product [Amoebophrya sp. A25]|eukprot:GSA25T00005995001.1